MSTHSPLTDIQPSSSVAPVVLSGKGTPAPSYYLKGPETRIQQGAAIIRNGSCLPNIEFDCAENTPSPLSPCCPRRLTCQGTSHIRCCPPRTECAPERLCANSSWTLYERDEYFCCSDGMKGYDVNGLGVCASPQNVLMAGVPPLREVIVDPAATPSLSPPLSDGRKPPASHSNAAIVGGTLGGIMGLAVIIRITIVLMRQKRRSRIQILPAVENGPVDDNAGYIRDDALLPRPFVTHQGLVSPCRAQHDGDLAPNAASFELQWTTFQPPKSGRSTAN